MPCSANIGWVIRNATREDVPDIVRLFLSADESVSTSLGTEDALRDYAEATFDGGGLFTGETVRVATIGDEVAGICVAYGREWLGDGGSGFVTPDEVGVDGLPDLFDDALAQEMGDIRETASRGLSYLDCLCVDERHRGHGLGEAMLADAMSRLGGILLYCRADNEPAVSLYRKTGFRTIGIGFGLSEDGDSLGPAMLIMATTGDGSE